MRLLKYSQIDRDFSGGIYLQPLGQRPSLEVIGVDYPKCDLYLSLGASGGMAMSVVVDKGLKVEVNRLLAQGDNGYYLYAPGPGVVGEKTTATVHGKPDQPVLTFHPLEQQGETMEADEPSATVTPQQAQKQKVWHSIEQGGIIDPHNGKPLAHTLKQLAKQDITMVVANATSLEETLNAPLAILAQYGAEVFAGLAIIRNWLDADEAIMAFPYHFPVNLAEANQWQVRCVPVSEKYPQGQSASLLRTLQKQKHINRRSKALGGAAVFDIQLLRQVERLILVHQLPTQRIVTICGDGVAKPAHFLAPVGMPIKELLDRASMNDQAQCVVEGTSMTGVSIDPASAVIGPASRSFMVISEVPSRAGYHCIRCGWCIDNCPAQVDPTQLLQFTETGQYNNAVENGLFACMDCGICSYICPSQLPIMERIRMVKRKLRKIDQSITT